MISNEDIVYEAVSAALRKRFGSIFIIGTELTDEPSKFPAVSILQRNSEVNKNYSTFEHVENVASEEYEFGMYSNIEDLHAAKKQTKDIAEIINEAMCELYYLRTFCQPIPGADAKITRMISKYKKTNVI